eukprot:3568636-Pleurochrysis_carterae.AAC.1
MLGLVKSITCTIKPKCSHPAHWTELQRECAHEEGVEANLEKRAGLRKFLCPNGALTAACPFVSDRGLV